jgi:hypothetical protein
MVIEHLNAAAAGLDNDLETKAIKVWVAAADAAVKGGEQPPAGGWEAAAPAVKRHYRVLAGGIENARRRDVASPYPRRCGRAAS